MEHGEKERESALDRWIDKGWIPTEVPEGSSFAQIEFNLEQQELVVLRKIFDAKTGRAIRGRRHYKFDVDENSDGAVVSFHRPLKQDSVIVYKLENSEPDEQEENTGGVTP